MMFNCKRTLELIDEGGDWGRCDKKEGPPRQAAGSGQHMAHRSSRMTGHLVLYTAPRSL